MTDFQWSVPCDPSDLVQQGNGSENLSVRWEHWQYQFSNKQILDNVPCLEFLDSTALKAGTWDRKPLLLIAFTLLPPQNWATKVSLPTGAVARFAASATPAGFTRSWKSYFQPLV